jgi:hypothetical protein
MSKLKYHTCAGPQRCSWNADKDSWNTSAYESYICHHNSSSESEDSSNSNSDSDLEMEHYPKLHVKKSSSMYIKILILINLSSPPCNDLTYTRGFYFINPIYVKF